MWWGLTMSVLNLHLGVRLVSCLATLNWPFQTYVSSLFLLSSTKKTSFFTFQMLVIKLIKQYRSILRHPVIFFHILDLLGHAVYFRTSCSFSFFVTVQDFSYALFEFSQCLNIPFAKTRSHRAWPYEAHIKSNVYSMCIHWLQHG